MSKVSIQVEVEKEINDVAQLLADIVVALKAKKPLLQIAADELSKLESAIAEVAALPADVQEDKAAAAKAVALPLIDALLG